mgnify:FL=1
MKDIDVAEAGRDAVLALKAQKKLDSLSFENPAFEALALYAGHRLAVAEDEKERVQWWDRCFSVAKHGSMSNVSRRAELAKKLKEKNSVDIG